MRQGWRLRARAPKSIAPLDDCLKEARFVTFNLWPVRPFDFALHRLRSTARQFVGALARAAASNGRRPSDHTCTNASCLELDNNKPEAIKRNKPSRSGAPREARAKVRAVELEGRPGGGDRGCLSCARRRCGFVTPLNPGRQQGQAFSSLQLNTSWTLDQPSASRRRRTLPILAACFRSHCLKSCAGLVSRNDGIIAKRGLCAPLAAPLARSLACRGERVLIQFELAGAGAGAGAGASAGAVGCLSRSSLPLVLSLIKQTPRFQTILQLLNWLGQKLTSERAQVI